MKDKNSLFFERGEKKWGIFKNPHRAVGSAEMGVFEGPARHGNQPSFAFSRVAGEETYMRLTR